MRKRNRSRSCVHKTLALLALAALLVPPWLEASSSPLDQIRTRIAQYLRRPPNRSAQWGIEIIDPTDNKVLFSVNPNKPFRPGSVVKVLTTAAALEKLGPNFRFRTSVYTDGLQQPDGVLAGDLILVGRGDPNLIDSFGDLLERPAFVELAEKLAALGIQRIDGDVIGDDSYFDFTTQGKGWIIQDVKSGNGAAISALSVHNNVFWIYAGARKPKQLVSVYLEPRTSYYRVRNLATTGSARSKQTIYARLIPGTRRIVVSGILPASRTYSHSIMVEKPAEAAATLFKEELQRRGISVSGTVEVIHYGDLPPEARRKWQLLAEHQSPPLIRALEIINKHSLNLHAEMLLRTLGSEVRGEGTEEAGLQVLRDFINEVGIDGQNVILNDGSGLSRENLLTPRFQTSLLSVLSTRSYFDLFLNTLAVSGTDGTLRNRLMAQPVRGAIRAKTGSLNGVSNLSGYMTTKSGRNLVFSIFTNNVRYGMTRIRRTIDDICTLVVSLY